MHFNQSAARMETAGFHASEGEAHTGWVRALLVLKYAFCRFKRGFLEVFGLFPAHEAVIHVCRPLGLVELQAPVDGQPPRPRLHVKLPVACRKLAAGRDETPAIPTDCHPANWRLASTWAA